MSEGDDQSRRLSPTAVGRVCAAVVDVEEAPSSCRSVGPYRLCDELGRGGMGVVYRAEQQHPIRRTVALKLIKPGMDSHEVIARFQQERQALAMMSHRNVAKVLDAGTSDDGRPYFVMEYVPGLTITRYCDAQRLTLRQRLELFTQACDAVQHAHQKAIIHRDLKPSNILVTGGNGDAEVKVIDFGVAKALSPALDQPHTLYTHAGQLIGTPDYMSPEQAASDGYHVDVRSDIYSLGVVLYELLTGALPFDPKTLRSSGAAEIQRILREMDPPRPSTRLSTLGETASVIASNRRSHVHELTRQLRGELEWIPLKAMRKEPNERYDSAGELAEDIRNYLEHKPLIAGPESRVYRLRKFARRNKAHMVALIAVVVLLCCGSALYLRGIRLEQAKTLAALSEAQRQRDVAEAVSQFFIWDMIGSAEPAVTRGRELTVREALDKAAGALGATLASQPVTEGKVRHSVAFAYEALGRPDLGLPHAQAAERLMRGKLGDEHPDTLAASSCVALLLVELGRFDDAESIFTTLLDKQSRIQGADHPATLASLTNYASLLSDQGKLVEAERLARDILVRAQRSMGGDDQNTLLYTNNLAKLLTELGRPREAEELLRQCLPQMRSLLGDDHPNTILSLNNLGSALQSQEKWDEARQAYEDALSACRRVNGDDHSLTLIIITNLAEILGRQGEYRPAEALLDDAIERATRTLGMDHWQTLAMMNHRALLLQRQQRHAEAATAYEEAIERLTQSLGAEHLRTITSKCNYAGTLLELRRAAEAEPLVREALAVRRRKLGELHAETLLAAYKLGITLRAQGQLAEAEAVLSELVSRTPEATVSRTSASLYTTALGMVLAERKQHARAEPVLLDAIQQMRALGMAGSREGREAVAALIGVYADTQRLDEAREWEAELARLIASTQPAPGPTSGSRGP